MDSICESDDGIVDFADFGCGSGAVVGDCIHSVVA